MCKYSIVVMFIEEDTISQSSFLITSDNLILQRDQVTLPHRAYIRYKSKVSSAKRNRTWHYYYFVDYVQLYTQTLEQKGFLLQKDSFGESGCIVEVQYWSMYSCLHT